MAKASHKSEATEEIKDEILVTDSATKEIYFYKDTKKGINQKSREVFKKEDKEIHYPIGYNGGAKYSKVNRFIYVGFNGRLPVGVSKSASRGLGFTKILKPLVLFLESNFPTSTIRIIKDGECEFSEDHKTLTLTEEQIESLHSVFKNNDEKQKEDREILAAEQLHLMFPDIVEEGVRNYIPNSIFSALTSWKQSLAEFTVSDKDAIKDLFDKLLLTQEFLSSETLIKTKESIDEQYIDDVISEYREMMKQKTETDNLEKKWQLFLKKHSWIFSYLFSFPIILLNDEAYVGGKGISNTNGKVTDFLIKNELTKNVAFIEIKTHKTDLIKKGKPYRGSDVFAMSSDLSGGITQVLNQRDNFQKHFAIHKMNSTDEQFESFNSKCVVLMGSIGDLSPKEVSSFELFRSNSKDVEIVTFDELLGRFENLRKLMNGNVSD